MCLLQTDVRILYKQAYKAAGFGNNRKKEQTVSAAVRAAQDIPDSFVKMLDSTEGTAHVTSMENISNQYEVTNAVTAKARCTCPKGQLTTSASAY